MEFDFGKTVEEIVMQAKENQEEFIFETIRPYCENILQMKINKEELKQILLNGTQRQQPKTGWISVSERLPEEYKRVLVSDLCSGIYVGQYVDAEENWGGEHFINECGMHSKSVVAWMPLPEPYKAESEVEE